MCAVRAIGCDGSSNTSNIVSALDWVAGNAQLPAIVVMSLGSSKVEVAMDNAVTAVVSAGIVAVTAAGNFNEGRCIFLLVSSQREQIAMSEHLDLLQRKQKFVIYMPISITVQDPASLGKTVRVDMDLQTFCLPEKK